MALPDITKLLVPPELGIARLRIPGFGRLTAIEQLQAAALALNRDLGVSSVGLRLAANAVPASSDEAWVAYTARASAANAAFSTLVFNALSTGKTYWVGAPHGYIVGTQGAAAVEASANSEGDGLPAIVAAMLSPQSGRAPGSNDCILVDRDCTLLNDDRLAFWQAASGVLMVDGNFPSGSAMRLVAAPSLQTVARSTTLDVALRYAAVASVICALIVGAKFVRLPAISDTGNAQKQPTPGTLLERVATVAPDVLARTQSATYASGAWVFSLGEALDAPAQSIMQHALAANGLQAQATGSPTPRVRVYLAP